MQTPVDETPQQLHLYPKFVLFQQLFRRHGPQPVIASFSLRDGPLWHGDLAIDLVLQPVDRLCAARGGKRRTA